jgi:hypothetical protein
MIVSIHTYVAGFVMMGLLLDPTSANKKLKTRLQLFDLPFGEKLPQP